MALCPASAPSSSTPRRLNLAKGAEQHPRQILAFDADNFYVCCERLKDPALVGKPVAVQQKNICATTSYEARAYGVDKLCLIKDAKKRCPDLIIVNGEDLTDYRKYSRRIFRLVKSIVWGNVEKLGMDELFVDVTAMIGSHIRDLQIDLQGSSQTFFNLDKNKTDDTPRKGFFYQHSVISGHSTPNADIQNDQDLRLAIASHLAQYIRDQIHSDIGFTTSAGIANSKVIAKLLASKNKPALQTTWLAGDRQSVALQEFLDPYLLQKIPGFGFRTLAILRHHIFKEPLSAAGTWTDAPEHTHPYEHDKLERQAAYEFEEHRLTAHSGVLELKEQALNRNQPLTVEIARLSVTLKELQCWFDDNIGVRLWNLLHGIDEEAVNMAADYPATVSVEDTYFGFADSHAVMKAIGVLTISLLSRLELEFVEEPATLEMSKNSGHVAKKFVRFPTQIRLTTRFGRTNRTSKSATFPHDVFVLATKREDRAKFLAKTTLQPLVTQAIDKRDLTELRLLNLAAVNFIEESPPPTVRSAIAGSSSRKRHLESNWADLSKDAIDLKVLEELPDDVREQLSRQLGIKNAKVKGQQSVQNYFTRKNR